MQYLDLYFSKSFAYNPVMFPQWYSCYGFHINTPASQEFWTATTKSLNVLRNVQKDEA